MGSNLLQSVIGKTRQNLSISAQLKAIREYVAQNNYHVAREFVDELRVAGQKLVLPSKK